MALILYHDEEATEEITEANPDRVRRAVESGQTMIDERKIYVKSDDLTLEYENITIKALNDEDDASTSGQINVEYALDDNGSPGTYMNTLELPDGEYVETMVIWRRATAPNVSEAFKRTDILHQLRAVEYVI